MKNEKVKSKNLIMISFVLSLLFVYFATQTSAAQGVIFEDNFDRTGTEINNDWVVTEPVAGNPRLSTAGVAKAVGTKGVLFEGSSEAIQAGIERIVDTSAYSSVQISYYRGINGLDEGDSFVAEYETPANGGSLVEIESIAGASGDTDDQSPTQVTYSLPTDANLLVRFRLDANSASDQAGIDELVISGESVGEPTVTPTPEEPTPIVEPTPTPTPEKPSYWEWFREFMKSIFDYQRQMFGRIWG